MSYFVGLDVSMQETAVCIVDEAGKVVFVQKAATEPDDLVGLLTSISGDYGRIGIEPVRSRSGQEQGDQDAMDEPDAGHPRICLFEHVPGGASKEPERHAADLVLATHQRMAVSASVTGE